MSEAPPLEMMRGPKGEPWRWLPHPVSHEAVLATRVLRRWGRTVLDASARFHVPANVIAAVIMTESAGNPSEVSPTDAVGLMQVTPRWFPAYPRHAFFDPATNVAIGTRYLAELHADGNDWPACFSMYACGPQPRRPWRPKQGKSPWGTCAEMAPHGDSVSITAGRASYLADPQGARSLWTSLELGGPRLGGPGGFARACAVASLVGLPAGAVAMLAARHGSSPARALALAAGAAILLLPLAIAGTKGT